MLGTGQRHQNKRVRCIPGTPEGCAWLLELLVCTQEKTYFIWFPTSWLFPFLCPGTLFGSNYFCCFDLQRHTGSTRWKHCFLWFFDWWVHAQAQTIEIILEIPRIPRLRRLARRTGFLARRTGFLARDCARLRLDFCGFCWDG